MHPVAVDYECILQAAYEALLPSGGSAIDVGADVGRHALPLARAVAPGGKVFAFEPLSVCRAQLEYSLKSLHQDLVPVLELSPDALGEKDAEAEFVVARDALAYSGLRPRPYDWPTRLERLPVRVRRLDDLFLKLATLDFVKIDAEGGELAILRGGAGCLRKFRPVVAFECGARSLTAYGATPADVARFFSDLAYRLYAITGDALGAEEFVRSAEAEATWDYLAVPAEQPARAALVVGALRRANRLGPVLRELAACEAIAESALDPPAGRRGPLGWLGRAARRVVLRLSRFLVRRQQEVNLRLLRAVRHLACDLARSEERLAELERRLGEAERAGRHAA